MNIADIVVPDFVIMEIVPSVIRADIVVAVIGMISFLVTKMNEMIMLMTSRTATVTRHKEKK